MFPLFILSHNIYLLTRDCLPDSWSSIGVNGDGWSALYLLVNVCMQFKSVFASYWVKWAICSTFGIGVWIEIVKQVHMRDRCQNKSVIFSCFSYKLMCGWHVIKALTVGVCFETEVIDSFLQAAVQCFSSGFLMKFSWPPSLISPTKEWWRGKEDGRGRREGEMVMKRKSGVAEEEKEMASERGPDRLSRLHDTFCRGWLSEKAECISI